jgi:RNA polymerase sigma-70 factor (ECF subfamily)
MAIDRHDARASPAESARDEARLLAALRRGDEHAFTTLVDRYHLRFVRVAMLYVADRAAAEEVAQETWVALLTGLDRFEGRAALKTWLFRILTNRAKTRAQRDGRTVPFSVLTPAVTDPDEPVVEAGRFRGREDRYPDHWALPPRSWRELPEERFLAVETAAHLQDAIAVLPPRQREVLVLRDMEGLSAAEVCSILEIAETNQRVLLHRARAQVRGALERYFAGA